MGHLANTLRGQRLTRRRLFTVKAFIIQMKKVGLIHCRTHDSRVSLSSLTLFIGSL